MQTILIVDDEPNYLVVLRELLEEEGFEALTADNAEKALTIARESDLDLVVTDMRMPGMDGMELLKTLKAIDIDLPIIMITAFGEVELAVTAMQEGAFTYLNKPFDNEELVVNIRKAVEYYSLIKENRRLRGEMRSGYDFGNIIGKNSKMQQIYRLIEKISPTNSSVLITGESGTGKELIAKAIHYNSPRENGPFISVNCAALPEALLESELFGHEKGAFTGAIAVRKGRFELAHNGTILLDEVGEMPLTLQPKLLRVIQEKSFERVGGSKTRHFDSRIIAATNKNLAEETQQGAFREDLFYRLNVLHVHLPPLRDRLDDVPLLATHFLRKFAKELNRLNLEIDPPAMRALSTHPWRGNIRELENTINRACILCPNDLITKDDLLPITEGDAIVSPLPANLNYGQLLQPGKRLPDLLDDIEGDLIRKAMDEANNIKARAAESLGITKSLLQYKIKKYGLLKDTKTIS